MTGISCKEEQIAVAGSTVDGAFLAMRLGVVCADASSALGARACGLSRCFKPRNLTTLCHTAVSTLTVDAWPCTVFVHLCGKLSPAMRRRKKQ